MADCDYCIANNHALCIPGPHAAYAGGAAANVVMRPCSCKRRKHQPDKRRRTNYAPLKTLITTVPYDGAR